MCEYVCTLSLWLSVSKSPGGYSGVARRRRRETEGEGRKRWWDLGLGRGRGGWGGSAAEATEAQAGMLPRQVANVLLYLLYFILLV